MKVEYLIIQNEDKNYCNSVESLEKLLTINDKISSIEKNLLTFEHKGKSYGFEFNITSGNIDNNDERYFKISISRKDESTSVDLLASLCREIKIIIQERLKSPKINTLWDDIGRVNKIEAKTNDKRKFIGELYLLDFIDLSNVLFKTYRDIELENVERIVLKCKKSNKIDIQDFEGVIAKSNWERYFSKILDIEESDLKNKWEELYQYRNYVAHNGFINKSEFDKIKKLCNDLKELLNKTISKFDKVKITESQKQKIVENFKSDGGERLMYRYYFKVKDKVVHVGITVDLQRREYEFKTSGKTTTIDGNIYRWVDGRIFQVGLPVSQEPALKWEKENAFYVYKNP